MLKKKSAKTKEQSLVLYYVAAWIVGFMGFLALVLVIGLYREVQKGILQADLSFAQPFNVETPKPSDESGAHALSGIQYETSCYPKYQLEQIFPNGVRTVLVENYQEEIAKLSRDTNCLTVFNHDPEKQMIYFYVKDAGKLKPPLYKYDIQQDVFSILKTQVPNNTNKQIVEQFPFLVMFGPENDAQEIRYLQVIDVAQDQIYKVGELSSSESYTSSYWMDADYGGKIIRGNLQTEEDSGYGSTIRASVYNASTKLEACDNKAVCSARAPIYENLINLWQIGTAYNQ